MTATLQDMIAQRDQLSRKIAAEERRQREERYRTLIALHNITLDQVQDRDEEGVPFFGSVFEFDKWCDQNSKKRFRSWNTGVYFAGQSFNDVLCTLDMLKGKEQAK